VSGIEGAQSAYSCSRRRRRPFERFAPARGGRGGGSPGVPLALSGAGMLVLAVGLAATCRLPLYCTLCVTFAQSPLSIRSAAAVAIRVVRAAWTHTHTYGILGCGKCRTLPQRCGVRKPGLLGGTQAATKNGEWGASAASAGIGCGADHWSSVRPRPGQHRSFP